ncbi:MAG TPA: adenylate/guanylate cyclase domain-containing protein [Actinomycetota bacterium]
MDPSPVRYAQTADGVHIAYQVVGDGPVDLVLVASALGLGEIWRSRRGTPFLQRLASFSRLIMLDRRGTGLSDHILDREQQLPLESRMEDVRAVMDAADSPRAILLGIESGGFAVAAMFAATLPERSAGLVGFGAMARELWASDYPFGIPLEESDAGIADVERAWGTDELAREWMEGLYPAALHDDVEIESFAAEMRGIGGPGDAAIWARVERDIDIRELLPSIRIPTLVVHRQDDLVVPIEHGRYLAAHIPGAELVELPGDAHMWDVGEDFPSEVERFVGTIHQEQIDLDRFLATVLFTDIVDSTARATSEGDRAWASLVERHHHMVRGHLARYRGTEMDTAGDGFFATFDGPARAIRCALAIAASARELSIEVRAGAHTGEMQTIDGKAGGIAVTIGARIMSVANASQVLVSQTVKDLTAGSGVTFEDAGEHELKGVPDRWHLYRVVDT